jgi:hypothetical protein
MKPIFMENNQHTKSANNTSDADGSTNFTNDQPGQRLPPEDAKKQANTSLPNTNVSAAEQHSESSNPQQENETLGTP